ncbi:MAG: aminotransferase class III-fold pyridoxal phosphate-dependent enzyme [Planctomycetota bacterium]|nr:aminotransferase class III-fold pyridoxal phosphate-dependent enzyme [Planctomycetota bacterium]
MSEPDSDQPLDEDVMSAESPTPQDDQLQHDQASESQAGVSDYDVSQDCEHDPVRREKDIEEQDEVGEQPEEELEDDEEELEDDEEELEDDEEELEDDEEELEDDEEELEDDEETNQDHTVGELKATASELDVGAGDAGQLKQDGDFEADVEEIDQEDVNVAAVQQNSAHPEAESGAVDETAASTDVNVADIAEQYSIASIPWSVRQFAGVLVRQNATGIGMVDGLAGRTSLLGLDCPEVSDAIRSAAGGCQGDASAFDDIDSNETDAGFSELITEAFGSVAGDLTHSMLLSPSADQAIEAAIMMARRYRPQRAFRTVALVGSDHGRTMLCRTASGRPELQEDLGPLVAGFSHVPAGDIDALDVAIDDQTACVLISPVLWNCGGEVLDAAYLQGVRRLCDERGVLLAVDETQVVFGSTGHPMAISSIAQVRPDLAVFSSGLFGGLPGGITLASERVTGASSGVIHRLRGTAGRFPLLANVLSATLSAMQQRGLLDEVASTADAFAVELAECVSRFEFVRDIQMLGLSIGLETDLESELLVRAARQRQLRLDVAGETAVRIQLPLVVTEKDRRLVVELIEATMASIQLSTADLSV